MNYRSELSLFGLPLIHVATGTSEGGRYKRGVARGMIAVGDVAFGVVAVGGLAVGGIAIGGLSLGVAALGGLALGGLALGGAAIGLWACGGMAVALYAALGGMAIAGDYAQGGVAVALHANDAAAKEFLESNGFMAAGIWIMEHSQWFVALAVLPGLLALFKALRRRSQEI